MTDARKRPELDVDETEALLAVGWRQAAGRSSCPDSALLLAADEGVLDDATTARIREHVAGCGSCQMLVKDLESVLAEADAETIARIRTTIDAAVGPPISRGSRVWIGAGVLAIAAAVVWFLVAPRGAPRATGADSQQALATSTPIPTVFVVDRPTIPPGDVDLTVRGESSTRVSLEDQIGAALDKADRADLAGATADLQALSGRNKASRIAALALGAVQLRARQNAEAAASLERALALKGDAQTADEVGWFLGMALVRTGDPNRARTILDAVCQHGGARASAACAGVAEIDRGKSSK
jgi:hypothetical protein